MATNGCFDLLHAGHIHLLESAKALGDILIVGINSDESVRTLKGPSRPINSAMDRCKVIAALWCVDCVTVFDDVRATKFLKDASPKVWVKGGDYNLSTLDQSERNAIHGAIVIVPTIIGLSTTGILTRSISENRQPANEPPASAV